MSAQQENPHQIAEASAPPIIDSVQQATAAWLTSALRASGMLTHGFVTAVSSDLINPGQTGLVARLHLEYDADRPEAPSTAILKLPATDPGSRAAGQQLGMYEAEVRLYMDIAPTLPITVPVAFYGRTETGTGRFTLLLEDLADIGEPGDMIAGGTPDDAARALRALVGLQAPRWADPSLHKLHWLANPEALEAMFSSVHPALPRFLERFADQLAPDDIALMERAAPKASAWASQMTSGHTVIMHGDFRMDNLIFPRDTSLPVVPFDWQTVRLGPPALDAGFYLGSCLSVEDRREHERPLLRDHHQRLLAAGVTGFCFEDLWESYRFSVFYGLLLTIAFSLQLERTERGDALFRGMIAAYGQQIRDLESEQLLD